MGPPPPTAAPGPEVGAEGRNALGAEPGKSWSEETWRRCLPGPAPCLSALGGCGCEGAEEGTSSGIGSKDGWYCCLRLP